LIEVARPVQTLKILAPGSMAAIAAASRPTTSPTNTKSRSCSPSPSILIAVPPAMQLAKIEITPE
jgi:hypothetical protein